LLILITVLVLLTSHLW